MTHSFHISNNPDPLLWKSFVENHDHGNIFHTPEMHAVFSQSKCHSPETWSVIDQNDRLLALFNPVTIHAAYWPLRFFTKRCISYGSYLCDECDSGRAALQLLFETYNNTRSSTHIYTELRNLHDISSHRHLLKMNHFCHYGYLNYLIPLELPEESMLSRISRSTRKKIKHEIRLPQIEMITADHPDQIDICYDILQKSYRHNCVPLADKSLFINAFRILHPKKMILFTLAKFKNEYIAASVDLLFKNTMYGWYGGFDRDYAKLLPNEMIMWHLLSWGAKNHYQWYDFGGAGQPEQKYGVRNFKAKFGGNLVNYGRYLNVHAPLRYCLGTVSYKILQKLSKLCRMRFIK